MFGRMKKRVCAAVAAVSAFAFSQAYAAYEFVTVDGATGDVTFTPGNLITPVLTGIVAIVGAIGAIWVIKAGISWLGRLMSRA